MGKARENMSNMWRADRYAQGMECTANRSKRTKVQYIGS